MTVLTAYRAYMRVAWFSALRGVFDFNGDYRAYCAMAAVDISLLDKMAKNRRKALGVTVKQVKFSKVPKAEMKTPEKVKGSLANARAAYDREYAIWCKDTYGTAAKREKALKDSPMHLTHTTGEQGAKGKDGTLVAHYSVKRPRKISTPFGTDADNKEVF